MAYEIVVVPEAEADLKAIRPFHRKQLLDAIVAPSVGAGCGQPHAYQAPSGA